MQALIADHGQMPEIYEREVRKSFAVHVKTYQPSIKRPKVIDPSTLAGAEFFKFEFTAEYVALDEQNGYRKQAGRCTLPETQQLIALRQKKIAESAARLQQYKEIVQNNPHWANQPDDTMWSILGVTYEFDR